MDRSTNRNEIQMKNYDLQLAPVMPSDISMFPSSPPVLPQSSVLLRPVSKAIGHSHLKSCSTLPFTHIPSSSSLTHYFLWAAAFWQETRCLFVTGHGKGKQTSPCKASSS